MAEANAAAAGLWLIACGATSGRGSSVPAAGRESCAFADPASAAAMPPRYLDPEDYTPPLSALRARWSAEFPLAVKIAPGVTQSDLRALDAEVEFVSLGGELKECVLWFGPFRTVSRRATVLPSGDTISVNEPAESRPIVPVDAVLYDPDPAVTRAGLVHDPRGGHPRPGHPIDPQVQLLTSDRHTPTPFATAFAVEYAAPFHAKLLRDYFRQRHVGCLTIIKRGSPADAVTTFSGS